MRLEVVLFPLLMESQQLYIFTSLLGTG